ncbi:uncharacterized protein V1513DRAFT_451419 [Lipomyces chichibuensis]|uniref:uncharacterized protein n=1 Tax=Lipomyces chichibuensis TaxID=1546026 RepID=UPI0033432532
MTDSTNDSQKQLLISLLRSSSTVEQALETYDSRIKNKPLPLHPTQPPRTARNDGKEAKQGKQYPAIRVQDARSSRYSPKHAFTKPSGRIRKFDGRERRRFEREFRKYEKIVDKKRKLRERRKRNERRRRNATTAEEDGSDFEVNEMQGVEVAAEQADPTADKEKIDSADNTTAKPAKPKSKSKSKSKPQSAKATSKTKSETDGKDTRTADEKVKSSIRNASALRKRRSKRAKKFLESAALREQLISLAQSDTLGSDSDNDDALVDETGDGVVIHRPKPLSSAEKKRKKLFDLRPEAANFRIYVELYKLWQSYAAELLGLTPTSMPPTTHGQLQTLASKLSSADFHGAYAVVDRSKCVSRVSLEGIILRDTRSAFVIVTKSNALRILPKEHTVFRIGVRKPGQQERFEEESDQMVRDREVEEVGDPKFELFSFLVYGSQLMYRPADRSGRKFKSKPTGDL